jgi:hypothetical protein
MKAKIAYLTSKPSHPLADGLKKSDTGILLDFFEAAEDISSHTLWDVPMDTGATALVSSLNVNQSEGFAEINHTDDPDLIEPGNSANIKPTTHECIKMPVIPFPLPGQTSTAVNAIPRSISR